MGRLECAMNTSIIKYAGVQLFVTIIIIILMKRNTYVWYGYEMQLILLVYFIFT